MYGRVIAKCLQKEMYECEKRTLKYKYKKKMQNFDEVLHFFVSDFRMRCPCSCCSS